MDSLSVATARLTEQLFFAPRFPGAQRHSLCSASGWPGQRQSQLVHPTAQARRIQPHLVSSAIGAGVRTVAAEVTLELLAQASKMP